jgi:hypothetical protein
MKPSSMKWFRLFRMGTVVAMDESYFMMMMDDTKRQRFTFWDRLLLGLSITWWVMTRKFPSIEARVNEQARNLTLGDEP